MPMLQATQTGMLVEASAPHNDTSAQPQSERDKTVADNGGGSSRGGVVKNQCGHVNARPGSFSCCFLKQTTHI